MWQDNISWKEGLLSAVTYENINKLKSLSSLKNHAVYDRKDAGKGDDWSNLIFQAVFFRFGHFQGGF